MRACTITTSTKARRHPIPTTGAPPMEAARCTAATASRRTKSTIRRAETGWRLRSTASGLFNFTRAYFAAHPAKLPEGWMPSNDLIEELHDYLLDHGYQFTEAEFTRDHDWIKRYLAREMYIWAFDVDESDRVFAMTDPEAVASRGRAGASRRASGKGPRGGGEPPAGARGGRAAVNPLARLPAATGPRSRGEPSAFRPAGALRPTWRGRRLHRSIDCRN